MFTDNLTFINSIIINIAVIVSTILTFYFGSLYMATKKNRTNLSFISSELLLNATLPTKLLVGISLGFISFILSINRIPLFGESNGVDMRYVIVYLAVIYGSDLIGIVTSGTLIGLKYLAYLWAVPAISFSEYFNNLVFTLLLLGTAIILRRKSQNIIYSNLIFLTIFIFLRFLLFSVYFYPFFQLKKLTEFTIYVIIYSTIFLLTSLIINTAISVSQSVHVYRTAAIYDGLTGVYNKESFHFFLDYVSQNALKSNEPLSLSVIDIDNFKAVNDNFGHPTGDAALAYLAKQLQANAEDMTHYICRIGGDEFAIIHKEEPEKAESFFSTILTNLKETPFQVDDQRLQLELSIGMTHFSVNQDFNMEVALQEADRALYQAKEAGKKQLIVTYDRSYKKRS